MKLLIVDDNKYVVESLKKTVDWPALGIHGVFGCYQVEQAKEILSRERIDLLITDIEMPGESGFDLLEWIRQQGMDVETVLLTSYAEFSYAQSAVEYQCFRYLLKPVDPKLLEDVMGKLAVRRLDKERLREDPLTRREGKMRIKDGIPRREGESPMGDAWIDAEPEDAGDGRAKTIAQVRTYIEDHLEDVSRGSLAEAFYLSPNYLSKVFRMETGASLSEYIQMRRIERAKEMLKEGDLPISEVAARAGYDSFAHFSNRFKKFVGVSPNEYRKAARRGGR